MKAGTNWRVGMAASLVGLAVLPVFAQETTGAIIGNVTSQDGMPLPGVTVQLADPAKGFERTVVAAADGRYKLVALPPARYELTGSLAGFQTVKRAIRVELGRTVTADVVMPLGAVTETLEVTAEAPLVDVTSSVTGLNVNADDFSSSVPVGREANQIALMAPGTIDSDRRFDTNRTQTLSRSTMTTRGSSTPGQEVVSIAGSSVAENRYLVNGLDVTNAWAMMGSTFVPLEFVEEVQIKTGGYEAEFGRSTGGVINMVTKSGTNTFRGGASAYWYPEALQDTEPDAWDQPNTEEFFESTEANVSLGGPFVRDRLFFFAFLRYVDTENSEISGTREEVIRNAAPYYGFKVDWNLTPGHRLEGTYLVDETTAERDKYVFDQDTRRRGEQIGTGKEPTGGPNGIVRYTGILRDNLLLAGQFGRNDFEWSLASDRDEYPAAFDCRTGYCTEVGLWLNRFRWVDVGSRDSLRVDVDWFVLEHSLRAGIEHQAYSMVTDGLKSGEAEYIYQLNGFRFQQLPPETEIVRVEESSQSGTFESGTTSAYAQDSWSLTPNLTLNLGLRWEGYDYETADGETFLRITDQWAPRIGVIWDPSGAGRQRLFASYGRYHLPIAGGTSFWMGSASLQERWYYILEGDINPDGRPEGLGEELDYVLWSDGTVPDPRAVVDSDLDPMSQDELILGFETMVGDAWSVGAQFMWRSLNHVIEDIALNEALLETTGSPWWYAFPEYRLTNPGTAFTGWVDLDLDGELDPVAFSADEVGMPEAQREYYAVELSARRRFASGWMLDAAYTWSQSYGNYEGMVKSDIGQSDFGLTQDFDFRGLMDNSHGLLPNHRTHNLKVYGAYAFDVGLQLGGFASYRSGRPRNAIGLHPTDPFAQLYGNASLFYADGTPAPRGTVGRTDDLVTLDVMARYDFEAAGIDWWVRLDVFNLLGADSVAYYGEYSTDGNGNPDPSFGEPIYYQNPQRVRVGAGLTF